MWKRKEFASHEPIILANVEMVRSNDDIARSVGTYWRLRLVYRVVEPVVNLHSFHQVCGEAVAMCKSGDLVAYQLRVLKRRNTRISTVCVSYLKKMFRGHLFSSLNCISQPYNTTTKKPTKTIMNLNQGIFLKDI